MATQQSVKEYAEKYHRGYKFREKWIYKPILFPLMTLGTFALFALMILHDLGKLP